MKKVVIFLLLAALLLTGCAGKKYTVNAEDGTVSDGKYTYEYTESTTEHGRVIQIVYPNGGIFRWEEFNGEHYSESRGQGIEKYDPVTYTPGENLVEEILGPVTEADEKPHEVKWEMIIAGILLIGFGIFLVAEPELHWYWRIGMWFVDGEPSDEGLGRIMAGGYIAIIFGVISILAGIFF